MTEHERLKRIHALRAQLERMPASPDRDRILDDVRRRAVDIETGGRTTPLREAEPELVLDVPEPPIEVAPAPRPKPTPVAPPPRTKPPSSPSSVAGAVAAKAATQAAGPAWLPEGITLSLEDDAVAPEPSPPRRAAPWARGLRG